MEKLPTTGVVSDETKTSTGGYARLGDVHYFDEEMPNDLSDFEKNYWVNDIHPDFEKELPEGFKIVRSGRIKDGDILWSIFEGWGVDRPVSPDDPESYYHYMGRHGKGCEVGHWKCVARRVNVA